MVAFNNIPSALRTPFVAVEIDNSKAVQGAAALAYRALIIGQKYAAAPGVANSIVKVTSADAVATLAGRGSMLHRQALAWFAANKDTECWIGILSDDGAGTAAASTVTFTGNATAAGAIYLYVGGVRVTVPVAVGDTPTIIATALTAAIGATAGLTDLSVHAGNLVGVLTLTANNKGAVGNELDVRVNYVDGEALPAGVTAAVVAPSGGATNPVLTTLISALGDSWFQVITHPYTDATSLTAIETELASRFGPARMIDGVAITAKADTYGNVSTLGAGRNSPHSVILRTDDSPTPPMEYAAHVAGMVASSAQIDPARPLQTLPLTWVKAPAELGRDTLATRNQLLYSGISTTRVGAGDVVQIERLVTTYKTNIAGTADESYLSVETMFSLMYARFSFRARISSRYPRHKLGNDSTRYPAGEPVMTPMLGRAEAVAWYLDMSTQSPVVFDPSGLAQFKNDLVVVRNASNPNRLDFLLPPDLINQLIVAAGQIQFIL
jgi:phage tail sheath gpL-like